MPDQRLVFTWGTPGDPAATCTVALTDTGDGQTRMTFHVLAVGPGPLPDGVRDGWSTCFDHLVAFVA